MQVFMHYLRIFGFLTFIKDTANKVFCNCQSLELLAFLYENLARKGSTLSCQNIPDPKKTTFFLCYIVNGVT